jgi:hypothetical protein
MSVTDFNMEELLTFDVVCETVGARRSLVARLAQQGLLEALPSETSEPMLSRRSIMQLRRMQRLRRDLGVNYTGAAIIIDLVQRIRDLNRELAENRERFNE